VKSWTKASVDGRKQHDIMMIHMQPKYAVRSFFNSPTKFPVHSFPLQTPSAAGAPRVRRTAKRKLDDLDDIEDVPVQKEEEEVPVPGRESLTFHARTR
jgi:hypothetical protein